MIMDARIAEIKPMTPPKINGAEIPNQVHSPPASNEANNRPIPWQVPYKPIIVPFASLGAYSVINAFYDPLIIA